MAEELAAILPQKHQFRLSTASYSQSFGNFYVSSLTEERHQQTCGYWYVVSSGAMSHTAFANRDHLITWLEDRGLSMLGELSMAGTSSCVAVEGHYILASHLSYDNFMSLDGKRIRMLDNGEYTLGVITEDDEGVSTVHHLNCNLNRMVYDYAESRKLFG